MPLHLGYDVMLSLSTLAKFFLEVMLGKEWLHRWSLVLAAAFNMASPEVKFYIRIALTCISEKNIFTQL